MNIISDEAITAAATAIFRYNKSLGLNSAPHVTSSDRVQALQAIVAAVPHLIPRTVTTAEQVDALRRFTVIRSAEGSVYEKQTMWHEAGSRDLAWGAAIALPVAVLQEGWGDE